MPPTLNRLIPYWKPITLALAAILCLYAGWHARGVVYEAKRAEDLRQMAEKRRKQEEDAHRQDAANEAEATRARQVTDERTKTAYQKAALPDRAMLLPNSVLLELDAAAATP